MMNEIKQNNITQDNPQQCGLSLDELIANGGHRYVKGAYACQIRRSVEDYYVKNDSMAWLIATYYDMILAEGLFQVRDIESGFASMQLLAEDRRLFLNQEHLKWYYASESVKREYDEILMAHPEFVYLTLEEMKRENFVAIEEGEETKTSRGNVFRFAYLCKVENGEEVELPLEKSSFANDGNDLDDMHMLNVLFRQASFVLKGTEYEGVVWKDYSDKKESKADFSFIKKLSPDKYVYLYVDFYYHT